MTSERTTSDADSILFVCLGNICRSPLAEGIFLHLLAERGTRELVVDSAGTGGWHAGEGPDGRALAIAKKRGVHLPSIARQVTREDFERFTHIIAMDQSNFENLLAMGAPESKLSLMRSYDPAHRAKPIGAESPNGQAPDVPDPYYGGDQGFEHVFDMLMAACRGLVDELGVGDKGQEKPR